MRTNKSKKEIEKSCLEGALMAKTQYDKHCLLWHRMLNTFYAKKLIKQKEAPDFIVYNEKKTPIIGIEHFLFDAATIYEQEPIGRLSDEALNKLRDADNIVACSDCYIYDNFVDEAERVFNKHALKCSRYRSNCAPHEIILMALLELPFPATLAKRYTIEEQYEVLNAFGDALNRIIFQSKHDFDYIILYAYPVGDEPNDRRITVYIPTKNFYKNHKHLENK